MRVGNLVHVAGTTATGDDGKVMGKGDAYAQTVQIFKSIARALQKAGASMRDVVRTRTFVTDISKREDVGRAHGEVFGEIRPVATMVEVSRTSTAKISRRWSDGHPHRQALRRSAAGRPQGADRLSHGGRPVARAHAGPVDALVRGGADLIELGVPFSDPLADGPVIQRAGQRAIAAGTNLRAVLGIACEIRRRSEVPLLLFTYLNPVLRYGLEALAREASRGADGVLVTDVTGGGAGWRLHGRPDSTRCFSPRPRAPPRDCAGGGRRGGFIYVVVVRV